MTAMNHAARAYWWLLQNDLRREIRAPQAWPSMLLTGLVLALLLTMLPAVGVAAKQELSGAMLWLALFFAGTVALDRSFSGQRDEGCWQSLLMYPAAPSVIFLAKMSANLLSLVLLECVLIPAFLVLSDVPLLARPGLFAIVLALGSMGFAAVGTLVSALTSGLSRRSGLLVLVLLPLVVPMVLGAAEATRLLITAGPNEQWWRWTQLLAAFAVLHTTLGIIAFEFVIED